MATKLFLQERIHCQAEAKIEVFCCVWFNGNVRTLPRIRSCRDAVSAWAVAKTAACLLLPWGKTEGILKRKASELSSAFHKGGWIHPTGFWFHAARMRLLGDDALGSNGPEHSHSLMWAMRPHCCGTELQVPQEPRKEGFLPEEPCTWMGPMLCTSLSKYLYSKLMQPQWSDQLLCCLPCTTSQVCREKGFGYIFDSSEVNILRT